LTAWGGMYLLMPVIGRIKRLYIWLGTNSVVAIRSCTEVHWLSTDSSLVLKELTAPRSCYAINQSCYGLTVAMRPRWNSWTSSNTRLSSSISESLKKSLKSGTTSAS
jgi:hypothetical protein